MTWLATATRRIGSPDAVSWPVFWVTVAAGIIGNLVTNADAPATVRLLALGLGQVALWLPLLPVGQLLRRRPDRPRPVLVLMAALGGLLMRAIVVGLIFAESLGPGEARWSERFSGALFNVGLAFVVSAYIVAAMRERRRQIMELVRIRRLLAAGVGEVSYQVTHRDAQAVAEVQAILLAEVNSLDASDPQGSLDVLRRTAMDVVRPLSHELAAARPETDPDRASTTEVRVSWRDVLDATASGTPFRPTATAAFLAAELVAAAFAHPAGAWTFPLLVIGTWVLVAVANGILRVILPGRSRGFRLSAVLVAAVLSGVVMAGGMRLALGGTPAANGLVIAGFAFPTVFALGVGIADSFTRDRDRIVAELEEASRNLRRQLVQWRQRQWFQQKSLSRALHGPVQSAVTAGALNLDSAIRNGAVDASVVEGVRRNLLETLGWLDSLNTSVTTVADALDQITATWAGICTVSADVDPRAAEALAVSTPLRSCVIDILTEATSNAVRHGGAKNVAIAIRLSPDVDDIHVEMDSDGHPGGSPAGRGLGSLLLDDCTLEWQLAQTPRGMLLTAVLPAGG